MFRKFIAHTVCLIAIITSLSACAPMLSGAMNASVNESSLKTKTAEYFNVPSESVTITDIEKGMLATNYKAEHHHKRFSCNIYYGAINCRQIESNTAAVQQRSSTPQQATAPASEMTALQAQNRLNQLGFFVGNADGAFGKKSVQQLKLFQKSRGLAETGKLDSPTVEALR